MGKRIHTRIFLLVIAVILLMTIGIGMACRTSSMLYVRYTAGREASSMRNGILETISEAGGWNGGLADKQEQRTRSKEILQMVKQKIRNGQLEGILLVFNSKYQLVYPGDLQEKEFPEELVQECQTLLVENHFGKNERMEISAGKQMWCLNTVELETEVSLRGKYFVAAAPVPDMTMFWNHLWKLFAMISAAAVALAALLVWIISRSISGPLENLCLQIQRAGDGTDTRINEQYSLKELESLKESYNQMEEKIRSSQEEKRRFFQNVSHDLKTPLASITGYAQGIACGVINEPEKAAGIILSESLRMTGLVESILSLTKMDNQELELHLTEIDLPEFLDECVEVMKGTQSKCSIRLELEEEELYLQTDPGLLNRILQNVISNSMRYAQQEVCVRLKQAAGGVQIVVEDDGPGFDEEDLPHVFERFYKGKNGKNGIGLAVVWSGIHYLGGTVEVGNLEVPQHGAYYHIYLPDDSQLLEGQHIILIK